MFISQGIIAIDPWWFTYKSQEQLKTQTAQYDKIATLMQIKRKIYIKMQTTIIKFIKYAGIFKSV